jgi:iron complex transport system substrate-binding protein
LKIAKRVFSLLLLLAAGTVAHAGDAPLRVLPLSPALAEWAAELIGLDPIVGITEYTDYPAGIEKKKNIGPYYRINFEVAMSLKPTLVLASQDGNSKDQIELFRSKKVPVVLVGSSSIEEMIRGMRDVAAALGRSEQAEEKLKPLIARLKNLEAKYAGAEKLNSRKILVQVSADPLVVMGRKTYLQDLFQKMRFENVVESPTSTYPRLSIESVLAKNPDTILILAMKNDAKSNERMRSLWNAYPKLSAVKNDRVRILISDELMRPGLRLVQGIDALEKSLEFEKRSTHE